MSEIAELKRKVLKLLKEDLEFRYAVAGLIGMEEILKRLDRHDAELARLREDMNKGFERHDEELAKLREDMNKGFALMERHISALGARWGLITEDAFREGLKGLLEEEFGLIVEKWEHFDQEGFVYGYPSQVEVDTAIKDGKIILVEVTSHARASDIYTFKRKAEFYEKVTGRSPSRLLVITPYAEEKAKEASKKMKVEIYTGV